MEATLSKLSRRTFEDSVFQAKLNQALEKAHVTVTLLGIKFDEFTEAWLDILKYFGENPAEYVNVVAERGKRGGTDEKRKQPVYVFVSLDLFFQSFKDAVTHYKAEQERARVKVMREERFKKKSIMSIVDSASQRGSVSSPVEATPGPSSQVSSVSTLDVKRGDSSRTIFKEPADLEDAAPLSAIFDSTESLAESPTGIPSLAPDAASQSGVMEGTSADPSPTKSSTSGTPSERTGDAAAKLKKKQKALQRLSRQLHDFSKTREVDIDFESRQSTDQILANAAVGHVETTEEEPQQVLSRFNSLNLLHSRHSETGLEDGNDAERDSNSLSLVKNRLFKSSPQLVSSKSPLSKSQKSMIDNDTVCPSCQMEIDACECDQ